MNSSDGGVQSALQVLRSIAQALTGLAQVDTDIQAVARSLNRLVEQTSLGVVVPIGQGGTGATTATGARTNLGLGTAAVEAASAPGQPNLASVILPVVVGHLATFADIAGTIQDGGTLPGTFGSAATKAASNPADPDVASVTGAVTIGHFATFADTNGSVGDGGAVGNAAHQAYTTGVWTPTLQFGGTSVGVTYGTRLGSYTQIGREVTCRFRIILTAKGSSTGAAVLGALPFTSNADATNSGSGGVVVAYSSMVGLTGGPLIQVGPSSTTAALLSAGAAATAPLDDTFFSNTSEIDGCFSFFV